MAATTSPSNQDTATLWPEAYSTKIKDIGKYPVWNTIKYKLSIDSYEPLSVGTFSSLLVLVKSIDPHYDPTQNQDNIENWLKLLWEHIRRNENYDPADDTIRKIKKRINRLAVEHKLNCRIINPSKYTALTNAEEARDRKELYQWCDDYTKDTQAKTHEVEKIANRITKKKAWWAFMALSSIVATGEAIVARMLFIAAVGITASASIVAWPITIGAFLVNFVLFKPAIANTFKDLFMKRTIFNVTSDTEGEKVRRLYIGNDGNKVSSGIKRLINTALISSTAAGISFGMLSLVSGLAFIAVPGVGPILAGIIAAATAASLTALYYRSIAKLIKNSFLNKLARYLIELIPTNKKDYQEKDTLGKAWEWVKALVNGKLLLTVIGLSAVFLAASFGMFYQKTIQIFALGHKHASKIGQGLAYIVTAVGQIVNGIFQIQSINSFTQFLKKALAFTLTTALSLILVPALWALSKCSLRCKKTWKSILDGFNNTFAKNNRVNLASKIMNFFGFVILTGSLVLNAAGQSLGANTLDARHAVNNTIGWISGKLGHARNFLRGAFTGVAWGARAAYHGITAGITALFGASFGVTADEIQATTRNPNQLPKDITRKDGSPATNASGTSSRPISPDTPVPSPIAQTPPPAVTAGASAVFDGEESKSRSSSISHEGEFRTATPTRTLSAVTATSSRSGEVSSPGDGQPDPFKDWDWAEDADLKT